MSQKYLAKLAIHHNGNDIKKGTIFSPEEKEIDEKQLKRLIDGGAAEEISDKDIAEAEPVENPESEEPEEKKSKKGKKG